MSKILFHQNQDKFSANIIIFNSTNLNTVLSVHNTFMGDGIKFFFVDKSTAMGKLSNK